MSLDEALKVLKTNMKFLKTPDRYREYSNYYLFFMLPEGALDGVIMLDKQTKKIIPYNPLLIPVEEADNPLNEDKINNVSKTIEHGRKVIEQYFKSYIR